MMCCVISNPVPSCGPRQPRVAWLRRSGAHHVRRSSVRRRMARSGAARRSPPGMPGRSSSNTRTPLRRVRAEWAAISHPGVGVAEHAAVLFVAGWIGGDLTEFGAERGERRLVEQDAVVRVEPGRRESSARSACAVSVPMPAITHMPWDSMKIWPSAFLLDPTGFPKWSSALRNQSPSQPWARTVSSISARCFRAPLPRRRRGRELRPNQRTARLRGRTTRR